MVVKFQFNWSPYKEDVFICGKKGSGKTERVRRILSLISQNIPYWIWSPQNPLQNYGGYAQPCSNLDRLVRGQYVYTGEDYSHKAFEKFLKKAYYENRNLVLVIDDLHEQTSKQSIVEMLYNMILSGRNRGISSILVTTLPSSVPNYILANCTHFFAYQMNLALHIEWLRDNVFGHEAWLLLKKDLRKKFYIQESDPYLMPAYSFLYRKDTDTKTTVVMP